MEEAIGQNPIRAFGESGDTLTVPLRYWNNLVVKTVFSKARYTVISFGIRRNEYVTGLYHLQKKPLLESGLKVKEYELMRRNSSIFGFVIQEQIDLGIKSVFLGMMLGSISLVGLSCCFGTSV